MSEVLTPTADRFQTRDELVSFIEERATVAVEKAGDEALVSALAMVCPFEPSEKQALLEAADLAARARLLLQLVEMDRLAQVTPPTARPQ